MSENLLPDEWDRAYAAGLEAARAAVTMTHDSSDIGTIAHLPECPWADRGYAFPCICDWLRACEQRVLDAAREAVIKCDHYYCDEQWSGSQHIYMSDALAAIDALRQPPRPTAHYDPAAKDNRP